MYEDTNIYIDIYICVMRVCVSTSQRSVFLIITSEQRERNSYQQSYIGHLDDIQTALKRLEISEKIEIYFL